ncbi:hypothetical protein [Hansschlegelia zhihuaiae]|uniref:Uncharacterized protein n=1 Tax=Hansschlegelia zhihuaiae TaxID=405005 RepID=A0A4Q0M3T0_9HYPH|nr:hypothetical protein [Hansschlegelia zhihuaiae]RXF67534.1 hypothetical protein EK403_21110 [Hansschlegelia zhihuaiae]
MPPPAEFAALERASVPPGPLYAALAEAERTGVAPFDALLASGAVEQEDLVATLAHALGVDAAGPGDLEGPAIDADGFRAAMLSGVLLGLGVHGGGRLIVAARGPAVSRLAAARRGRLRDPRIALATPRAFAEIAMRRAGASVVRKAADGPGDLCPEFTVVRGLPHLGRLSRLALIAAAAAVAACAALIESVGLAVAGVCGLMFVALNALRLGSVPNRFAVWTAC